MTNKTTQHNSQFPSHAPVANSVFYRTYSRKNGALRETWQEVCDRTITHLSELGKLTDNETALLIRMQTGLKALPSGRWLWVGGTDWIKKPENFYGGYNCSSSNVVDWRSFGLMMGLAMMGTGTGAVLERKYTNQLPPICNRLTIKMVGEIGATPADDRRDDTSLVINDSKTVALMEVGDSRQGWVESYQKLLELSSDSSLGDLIVHINLSHVRPVGEKLKGFGGMANPIRLPKLYERCAAILNKAVGRKLTPVECCLLIDEAAACVVAGNIRRSAGMRQFDADDFEAAAAKDNLWQQDEQGNWRIDPERDVLRMANHTRVFHQKPTLQECIDAVTKQFYSGEGAIQWAGEAKRRAQGEGRYGLNPCLRGDMKLLTTDGYQAIASLVNKDVELINKDGDTSIGKVWLSGRKQVYEITLSTGKRLQATGDHRWMTIDGETVQTVDLVGKYLMPFKDYPEAMVNSVKQNGYALVYDFSEPLTHWGVVEGYVSHNCGEIIGELYLCNLSEVHLNQIDPSNLEDQVDAFKAGAINVATLLNHEFDEPRYHKSRLEDPIVGVSFTGLFDFFVKAFGVEWLHWWEAGRSTEWNIPQPRQEFTERIIEIGNRFNEWRGVPSEMRQMKTGEVFKYIEQRYLKLWSKIVHDTVWEYCDRHGLTKPNRCTTVQPAGTKSLLTGASPGWHPPKAQRFIRRVTFRKDDPVALACRDYGYSLIPSQSDKDDDSNLLNNPFDPRCTEWLVEMPVEVPWANMPGCDAVDISKFSVLAQFDFYMQVQQYYTAHNCFSRDTKFLTDKGVKSFNDFEVGDTAVVLNAEGDWVSAQVVNTGSERPMLSIKIKQGKTGKEKVITSTYCHRFPVKRPSGGNSQVKIVTADKLKIGHRLVLNSADLPDLDIDGIRHGLVFGDGSVYKNKSGAASGCQLYLCGGKRHLVSFFETLGSIKQRDDIDQTRIYGLPSTWKQLPSEDCSQAYLAGFMAGLFATDGSVFESTISVCTNRKDVVDYLERQSPRLGIRLTSYKWFETNSYKDGAGAFVAIFSKSNFPVNMILRPHHLEHFQSKNSQPCQWKIVDITEADPQVGWCVMEPVTNHFTLEDNILVMNTSATLEMRQHEIEPLATRIYEAIQKDEGYISAALLARFDDLQTFPRLPFEPIDKATYEQLCQQVSDRQVESDFYKALCRYDAGELIEAGPAGCDSDKCMMPEFKPNN